MRWLVPFAIAFLGCATVVVAQIPHSASSKDSAQYQALIAQLRSGDTTADFTALRMLSSEMGRESTSGTSVEKHYALARDASDSVVARAHMDSILTLYYGHVRAHRDAEKVFEQRGDSTRARAEAAIVRGFIRSIGATGGLTPESAMPVVSIDEEYVFLTAHGVSRHTQALIKCGTYRCDALTGTDIKTGRDITYYFRPIWM